MIGVNGDKNGCRIWLLPLSGKGRLSFLLENLEENRIQLCCYIVLYIFNLLPVINWSETAGKPLIENWTGWRQGGEIKRSCSSGAPRSAWLVNLQHPEHSEAGCEFLLLWLTSPVSPRPCVCPLPAHIKFMGWVFPSPCRCCVLNCRRGQFAVRRIWQLLGEEGQLLRKGRESRWLLLLWGLKGGGGEGGRKRKERRGVSEIWIQPSAAVGAHYCGELSICYLLLSAGFKQLTCLHVFCRLPSCWPQVPCSPVSISGVP